MYTHFHTYENIHFASLLLPECLYISVQGNACLFLYTNPIRKPAPILALFQLLYSVTIEKLSLTIHSKFTFMLIVEYS